MSSAPNHFISWTRVKTLKKVHIVPMVESTMTVYSSAGPLVSAGEPDLADNLAGASTIRSMHVRTIMSSEVSYAGSQLATASMKTKPRFRGMYKTNCLVDEGKSFVLIGK